MHLEVSGLGDHRSPGDVRRTLGTNLNTADDTERGLTCMFYFFASQIQRNIQPADPDLVRRRKALNQPTHKLDTMLIRLKMHAAFSPLISRFEIIPVDIPDSPGFSRNRPPREQLHDTMLLMKFRNRRARQEFVATKEWQEFYNGAESQQVFRRMPHVRCASNLRGLMDPIDILTA